MRRAPHICIDRKVPLQRLVASAERSVRESARNAPLLGESQRGGPLHRVKMAVQTPNLWRDRRTLRVRFLSGTPAVHKRVQKYAEQWSEHCGITFEFGKWPDAEIRVAFDHAEGSWSWVGTEALEFKKPTEATLNLGWVTAATDELEVSQVVLHEFGHALGCIHEHQSPAAAIPWDKPAVYAFYAGRPNFWSKKDVDENIFDRYSRTDTNFSAFDPKSIMLYAIEEELTIGDYAVEWNPTLSATDKEFIGGKYPKRPKPSVHLDIGAPPLPASIGTHGEEDVYGFTVAVAGRHIVETHGPTNVVMSLRGPDAEAAVLAVDDDSGAGRNARIKQSLRPGTYVVRIKHFRPTGTGKYQLDVRKA